MKGYIIFFLMFLLIFSCNNKNIVSSINEVKFDVEAQSYYKKFDSILILKYGKNINRFNNFSKDYITALKKNQTPPLYTRISKLLPCDKDNINFSTIWIKYKNYCFINMKDGSYFKTLKTLSKNNQFIKEYVNISKNYGTISMPSIMISFARRANSLDFRNENNRIIFAIHYITIYNSFE